MAMIEINIHIPIDGVNNISIPIQLPVVPRVGEKIYLSDKQINNLISLLEEEYYHNPQTEEWKESIRRFTNIEEVAYNAANGTIHIELSTIYKKQYEKVFIISNDWFKPYVVWMQ